MKKVLFSLVIACSIFTFSVRASVSPSVVNPTAESTYQKKIEMLKQISTMDVKSFELMTGKHMNFVQRTLFKLEQRKLRNSFNEQGEVTNKKLEKYLRKSSSDDHSSGFHLGGFALGFLLGLIGVLIAYLINDDNKRNRTKWAWIGLGAWVVLFLLFFI